MLVKEIDNKNIIWFKNSNSYLVFEPVVAEILSKISMNVSSSKIENWCSKKLKVPKEIIIEFVSNIYKIHTENNIYIKGIKTRHITFKVPTTFISEKYYCINNYIFKIQYETGYHESKIHLIFAHLEIKNSSNNNFNYKIFGNKNSIIFLKNSVLVGKWSKKEVHLFQGKIFMQLLIDIYSKPEENWMGVFHASAISNEKESMLFLGDSGNGKSTSLALLNANGYNCIADDFVPVDNKKNIRTFPAAISIKNKSLKTLLPYYPELKDSAEYHLKKQNKFVKYITPREINYNQKLKCKALIFIKYNPEIELEVNLISKTEALQQLIPDSWISPLEENATIFLDWFLELPSYKLTYSNNQKMIETVSKIFSDDL